MHNLKVKSLEIPNTPVHTKAPQKSLRQHSSSELHTAQNTKEAIIKITTLSFACFLSQFEPRKVSEALEEGSWVEAINRTVEKNKNDERGLVVRKQKQGC
ncbi:hypothetical protein Tco_0194396 [Tanacetum coccineum]